MGEDVRFKWPLYSPISVCYWIDGNWMLVSESYCSVRSSWTSHNLSYTCWATAKPGDFDSSLRLFLCGEALNVQNMATFSFHLGIVYIAMLHLNIYLHVHLVTCPGSALPTPGETTGVGLPVERLLWFLHECLLPPVFRCELSFCMLVKAENS